MVLRNKFSGISNCIDKPTTDRAKSVQKEELELGRCLYIRALHQVYGEPQGTSKEIASESNYTLWQKFLFVKVCETSVKTKLEKKKTLKGFVEASNIYFTYTHRVRLIQHDTL